MHMKGKSTQMLHSEEKMKQEVQEPNRVVDSVRESPDSLTLFIPYAR